MFSFELTPVSVLFVRVFHFGQTCTVFGKSLLSCANIRPCEVPAKNPESCPGFPCYLYPAGKAPANKSNECSANGTEKSAGSSSFVTKLKTFTKNIKLCISSVHKQLSSTTVLSPRILVSRCMFLSFSYKPRKSCIAMCVVR